MKRMLVVAAALVLAVLLWPRHTAQADGPCTVPKSWGRLVAISDYSLPLGMGRTVAGTHVAFEAADGTVRVVTLQCDTPPRPAVIQRSEK